MSVPQYCPTPAELDDLELLMTGALRPTVAFNEPGSVVTLRLPPDVVESARRADAVEIVDPEGLPLARVRIPGGAVEPLEHTQYGPFRRFYLPPAETRRRYAGRTFVPLATPLSEVQISSLADAGPLVLLPLVGHNTSGLSLVALMRATFSAATRFAEADVVAVPLATHGDPATDKDLLTRVIANYAGGDRTVPLLEYDGQPLSAEIAEIADFDRPQPSKKGLVVLLTGLSGSGKSTLARALTDQLLEQGRRTITSLDGDVVRRHLSEGLSFSVVDRETNIRRIGWVAAEISRHGGVAICSPIAPFDRTREEVRAMVAQAGGAFVLVHVATPLEECERRDRKGLYARARRGEIPDFTGISSPYEEPREPDVKVDTSGMTVSEATAEILTQLTVAGYV
ncbi:MAG: adenylyl-sulfate kinase [Spirochaetaceae bacterium]|nr:adenylyl-sulfate kinase [Spirochaetaceae bacterium]